MDSEINNENNENVAVPVENVVMIVSSESEDIQPLKELVSSSQKKRKRSSPEKSRIEDDDDGSTCNICLDSFQSAGEHRIVSLKCGHIFGESCIRRWLQESAQTKCCPQCKLRATVRDIRFIYAPKVRAHDNSREHELLIQISSLQEERNRVITENSLSSMTIAMQRQEIQRLKAELELLRNSAMIETGRVTAGIRSIKTGRMYIEKNVDFKENLDSRLIKFLSRSKKLIVAQKSCEGSLFPGFGVKLIDFSTYRLEKFLNTNNKAVNDFTLDNSESYVVTTTKEATCKMYNVSTNQSINTFNPSTMPIWSCAFDEDRANMLYLGAQNGVNYIYDTRNAATVLREVAPLENRTPVKYTIPLKRTEVFPCGGILVVHVRALYFHEYLPSGETVPTMLNFNDPILVISYDERTEMILITKSPTGQGAGFKQMRHILMKLVKEESIPTLQEIYSFAGSSSTLPAISRPTQIKVPDGFIVASYLEDTKMLQTWTAPVGLLHEAGIQEMITDICPIYLDNSFFFGALSHSRCRLFKVNLGY